MADRRKNRSGTRRQQQKAETRALILDAARSLFEKKGFEKTTLRAVASKAGVGLGTIFNHVPDKGALLIAAFLDDLREVEERAAATLPVDASPTDQLLHLFALAYEYYARKPALSREFIRNAWFISGPWGERYQSEADKLLQRMTATFEVAQKQGILRPDASVELAAKSVYAFYGLTLIQELAKPEFDAAAVLKEMRAAIEQFIAGIGPP